jgi:hypothetical protein
MTFTAQTRIETTGRECTNCRRFKRWKQFHLYKRGVNGRRAICAVCENKSREKYAARRADYMFGYRLQRSFSITLEQYLQMESDQGGVCALCGEPETWISSQTGKVKRLSVEHDRRCCPGDKSCGKCIRGLTCCRCNGLVAVFETEFGQRVFPLLLTWVDRRPLAA